MNKSEKLTALAKALDSVDAVRQSETHARVARAQRIIQDILTHDVVMAKPEPTPLEKLEVALEMWRNAPGDVGPLGRALERAWDIYMATKDVSKKSP